MLNGLDVFTGIGGLTIALREWVRPVCYCEINLYAASVVFSRILDGNLPFAPVFPDIAFLKGCFLPPIDIVYGGSPCQGLSQSGFRRGLGDERSFLFYEQIRLARETNATWLYWENVGAASVEDIAIAARTIIDAGYTARAGSLSTAQIGGRHLRRRIWVLAHSKGKHVVELAPTSKELRIKGEVKRGEETARCYKHGYFEERKASADRVYRAAYGIPNAVDRIEALGNAVVPHCAREAFKRLIGEDNG